MGSEVALDYVDTPNTSKKLGIDHFGIRRLYVDCWTQLVCSILQNIILSSWTALVSGSPSNYVIGQRSKSEGFEIRVNIQEFVLFSAKFSQCVCKTSQQTFCVCCFEKFFSARKLCYDTFVQVRIRRWWRK